jgi:hypothetical protein
MRRPEELPIDPEIRAELDAIDATLAGRIVDLELAELGELTVMIAAERPQLGSDQARAMDERVLDGLAPGGSRERRWQWPRRGQWAAVGAVAAVAVAAVVATQLPQGGGPGVLNDGSPATARSAPAHRALGPSAHTSAAAGSTASSNGSAKSAPSRASGAGGRLTPATPAPTPSARKTIQSAQLQLVASGRWVDAVAQEVFDVAGQEKAIVRSSQVTAAAGNNGYASFRLSIPTANLAVTVTRLSELQHARVSSRTDGTVDVNGQYLSDQRRLADARALRTALLERLANATTQAQIDSLTAQLHDAEASISSDQATLRRLQNQISFSQLSVTVNGGSVIVPPAGGSSSSGGFTLGRAAHDAVRVLTVAAGVVLIALAALVPVALLAAVGGWLALSLRRRRREQALDTA